MLLYELRGTCLDGMIHMLKSFSLILGSLHCKTVDDMTAIPHLGGDDRSFAWISLE